MTLGSWLRRLEKQAASAGHSAESCQSCGRPDPHGREVLVVNAQEWPNLHHAFYRASWARRPKTGARRLMPNIPVPLLADSADERAAREAAANYYDRTLADP